jgi:hypothetical protein
MNAKAINDNIAVLQGVMHQAARAQEEMMDEELKRLENLDEDDLERMRQQRLEELKAKARQKQMFRRKGHGSYTEVTNEKEFFAATKASPRVACHFYRPTSKYCTYVDKHLDRIAKTRLECKFIKINAEKSPYLCEKLHIWMMPSIVLVVDRKTSHTICGFDELGGTEKFSTRDMEVVLANHGMIDLQD